jgi:hypothetical protein
MRRHAPDVLATAKAQRWEPAEAVRALLVEELAGSVTARCRGLAVRWTLRFGGWEVDAGVEAALFDRVGERSVVPVVTVDVAEGVDDLGEPEHVHLVAPGESPPGVERLEPLLERRDVVGRHVPLESTRWCAAGRPPGCGLR